MPCPVFAESAHRVGATIRARMPPKKIWSVDVVGTEVKFAKKKVAQDFINLLKQGHEDYYDIDTMFSLTQESYDPSMTVYATADEAFDEEIPQCQDCDNTILCDDDLYMCDKCSSQICTSCMPDECEAGLECHSWTNRALCWTCFQEPSESINGYCLNCVPKETTEDNLKDDEEIVQQRAEESIAERMKKRRRKCASI